MDWQDFSDLYSDGMLALKPFPKEIAELEFSYLTKCVTSLFPEAIDNALLLVATDKETTRTRLTGNTAETNLAFRRSGETFDKAFNFLYTFKATPDLHPKLNSHKYELKKEQVIYCLTEWLREQGWEDPHAGFLYNAPYDLKAVREGINLFAFGLGSPSVYEKPGETTESLKKNYTTMVANLVFTLLDEMMKAPDINPALVLPDDHQTRQFMKNYQPITRLGITVFWVTSMAEVTDSWG